jgi:hypothetical protein
MGLRKEQKWRNEMANNVTSLITARRAQIVQQFAESSRECIYEYKDKKMEELGVDRQDEQANRAVEAMNDVWFKKIEIQSKLIKELFKARKAFEQATKSGMNERIDSAESMFKTKVHKLLEGDLDIADAYFFDRMDKHGVNLEDEQANGAIRAMSDVCIKHLKMKLHAMREMFHVTAIHEELRRRDM